MYATRDLYLFYAILVYWPIFRLESWIKGVCFTELSNNSIFDEHCILLNVIFLNNFSCLNWKRIIVFFRVWYIFILTSIFNDSLKANHYAVKYWKINAEIMLRVKHLEWLSNMSDVLIYSIDNYVPNNYMPNVKVLNSRFCIKMERHIKF